MVRIDLGEDIIESLKKLCENEHILLGRVEAIGATDHAVIGVYDLAKKEYYPEKIDEFMEEKLVDSLATMNNAQNRRAELMKYDKEQLVELGLSEVFDQRIGFIHAVEQILDRSSQRLHI